MRSISAAHLSAGIRPPDTSRSLWRERREIFSWRIHYKGVKGPISDGVELAASGGRLQSDSSQHLHVMSSSSDGRIGWAGV